MKKKVILSIALMVMCLASVSQAMEIIIVTNNTGNQAQYKTFLETLYPGVTVTIGTYAGLNGNPAMLAELEAADLIIISRNSNSGDYDEGTEIADWNGLTTPILNHNAYLSRNSRFKWLNATEHGVNFTDMTVVDTADPFFLPGLTQVGDKVTLYSANKSSYDINQVDNAGNGKLIAKTAENEVFLAYWEPLVEYYDGAGQYAGGWRVWLAGPEADYFEDLTADGAQLLTNALDFLVTGGDPAFNFAPTADAGSDILVLDAQFPVAVQLAGTAEDVDSPGMVSYWVQQSGPAGVTFDDETALDAIVTLNEYGIYEFFLQADDGNKDANDLMKVIVRGPEMEFEVARWDFEDATTTDPNIPEVIGGNDGLWIDGGEPNNPVLVAGWIDGGATNQAGKLDGLDDKVTHPFALPKPYGTISHWIKPAEIGRNMAIYHESSRLDDGWGAGSTSAQEVHTGINADSSFIFLYQDGPDSGSTTTINAGTAPVDTWTHLAVTWNIFGDAVMYVNGLEVGRSDMTGDTYLGIEPQEFTIGGISRLRDAPDTRMFNGVIDQIRVFNYDITAQEILALTGEGTVAPVVDAGDDIAIDFDAGNAVNLAGIIYDFDNGKPNVPTVEVSQLGGPAIAAIAEPASEITQITFPQPGVYEFQILAYDGYGVDDDTVIVRVHQDQLIAYWSFETSAEPNDVADDSAYNNIGDFKGGVEPNVIDGWITNATPNQALSFAGDSYVEITDDENANFTFDYLRNEVSVAAWVKVDEFTTSWSVVVGKGDDSWRLTRNSRSEGSSDGMFFGITGLTPGEGLPDNGQSGNIPVADGNWHHVVGTYDGQLLSMYIDGVLDVQGEYTGLIPNSSYPVLIGENAERTGRLWNGGIDDVRVYNYALSIDEIQGLVGMGVNLAPRISAGPDKQAELRFRGVLTEGFAFDIDNGPEPLDISWQMISSTAPEPNDVVFAPPADPNSFASFKSPGQYVLRLTVFDGISTTTDDIVITAVSPTCEEAYEDGVITMLADFNKDCRVDFLDMAMIAEKWMICNDPENLACLDPYAY